MNKDVIRKVYDAMSKEYDMAEDFDTFAQDIQNKDVARRVYDAMYDRYRMEEDFEEFYKDLTFMPSVDGVKTTESGSVVVDEAPKQGRITLADTLNASVPGMVSSGYTEEVKEEQEKNMLTQEERDQRAAMRQRLQEDGTIDRMKELRKEARREKLRAFGSMLGSTPQVTSFGVSTNVFDSTDEQLADVGQALDAGTEYRQNKLLQEKLDVALDMARAGENQDGLRGVENFGLGLWDSATRLSTWDFGASDIVNNLTLQQIVEKWENDPSSLTATEQKVLEGIGMATAVQELYSDQVGIGYNVGQSLPESAGFMASMALNPASGLGKSLARNAVRTYGRNSIAKNLARIGGDIAETAIMTATTGAGRVAADALERINGSSTYEIGDNGVIMYGGQKDQEAVGDAVLKAIGSNFIENYSEALGEYFDPLLGMSRRVAAGGLRKMHLNKWADALSDVQPSQMTASIRSLREKTKFGGIFGEIMEEEIGMALNTLFVGDNKWSDFADLETQLTTVLSCAIMSGTLNGIEQVSSVTARRRMEKNAKNAEQSAANAFGEQFAELRENIDQASPEGMVDVLRDVYMNQGYSLEQKRKLAEYAAARLQMQYYNAADAKARREVNKTQQGVLDAYEAGRHAQLPTYYNIEQEYRNSEEAINASENAENIWAAIETLNRAPLEEHDMIINDFTEEEQQIIRQYRYNAARVLGAVNSRAEQAEDLIDEYRGQIAPFTKPDGTVTTAILGDNVVFVMEQNENGDAVVHTNDGRKIFAKTRDLEHVETHNAEDLVERFRQSTNEAMDIETENSFEHHPKTQAPQVGLQLQSPEGEVVITAINDNMVEIVPAVYKDGQVQPKEGAEPRTITVDDAYAWQDDYYLSMDADQAYANAMAEASNMSAETTRNESTPSEQIEQSVSEEVTDGQNAETQPTETESVAPAVPQTARERVPKDKEGNPIYEQTDADTAWDAIVEETEGDTEMAQRVAADMLEDKKAALAKLQKGKPKKGATVAEKIANEKVHQAAIAQAQNDVAQWEAIVGTEARRREAAMSEAERYAAEMEQKNISEGLKALGEPQSLEEYVLGQLAGGAYKLRWSDKENGTKGFGSHTGLSTEEMNARLSMIDNKNGLTPEEIAHSIVENMDASFGEVDVMDVTNMVIDAVATNASRRAMLDGMVESRAELMRQQARAEQEAKDAWYMEQYHATEEELAAYSEYLAEITEEIIADDANYEERFNTFAELIADEYDNQGTDADIRSSADQGEGLASDREGSSSVGEGEETDRQGAVLGDATRFAEAEDGGAGSSVSAQSNVDFTREELENGDVRIINRNSNGEIATVAIERDGKVIQVDSYEDGALFERTDYDANGNATKVTRYKDGEVVSEQEYKDGKRKVTANVFEMAEEAQKNRKAKKDKDDTARRSIQESPAEADRVSGEIFGGESLGEEESVPSRSDGGILEEGAGKKKRTAKARRQSDNRQEARDGKAERLSRGISPVQQQAIDEYTRTNPWDANLTDDERDVLNMYRMATINELDELAHKLADKINNGKATPRDRMRYDVLAAYAKSGELKAVADAMGVEYGGPVSLDTIKSLFETFNSDPELAVLFDRVFPLVKEINPTIVYRRFTEKDLGEGEDISPDDILGQYTLQDNLIEYNRNQIDSNHCTEQEKASTIVHEMIHAVARYAIRVQEAHNNGVELDIQLPKRLLDAAQSLIEVYDAIKDNEIFNDDRYESGKMYGVSSVHEMLSELANPEFREKLKQVSIENLPSDKKGRVRDALRAIKDFIHRMFGWDSSSAYARTKRALDKLIDNYDSAGYNKAMDLSDDDFAQQIRLSSEEDLRFRKGAPFFSNAERAVENIKQNKATPEQWLAMIKKDGGLKAGEDKWMGLSDWLNEQKEKGVKTLTKDEVLAFIRENQIEIEEVEYGDNPVGFDELKEEYESMLRDEGYDAAHDAMIDRFGDDFDIAFDDLGGELTIANEEAAATLLGSGNIINSTRLEYTTEGLDNKKEIAFVIPTIESWNQSDNIHFGDAGEGRAVAWVRFGETTDEDGNRVLVIDEVQSKRHDEGRAKGYSDLRDYDKKMVALEEEAAELLSRRNKLIKVLDEKYGGFTKYLKHSFDGQRTSLVPNPSVMTAEEIKEWNETSQDSIREREDELKKLKRGVPDAPFDKNYHELVMKRMLRYAAENGFDKVAWTKGKQQAERYGLSTKVSEIAVRANNKGTYNVVIEDMNGSELMDYRGSGKEMTSEELSALVGKELSSKLIEGARRSQGLEWSGKGYNPEFYTIRGVDLSIGGEDRNALYDEMIPRFMNKYTKKWGTKVGEVTLPNVEKAGRTMWSVDVTPEMRESVMQGQPMFREGMGAISDREVSYENDPIAKFQGKPRYYGKKAAAFAERERRRMENAAKEAAEMLGIEAEIITDASTLQGRKAKEKGWYDIVNKKVVVVVPNHVSMGDAVRTVLHEGIAHHGLRELFGDGFDAMLDNVYNNVAPELKARIDAIAERTGVSTSVATEEYLASLAETTNFEEAQRRGWWQKIKSYFVDMLRKLSMPGLKLKEEITDNELRYLLWRSYKNLVEPNSYLKPLGYAEDVVKQKELKVGEYAEKALATPMAADTSEAEEWAAVTMQRIEELEAQAAQLENEIAEMEADRDADDASRYEMWEQQLEPLRKQMEDVYAELEGLYSLEAEAEEMSMASEDAIRYRLVDDPAEIERLESEPTIKAYRAMQVINGELYPPMSAVVDGKLREPIALGQWERSEERPDLADDNGRFKLDKGNKKSLKAAYNPYFHSSSTPLNDQFSEAQDRDNLVTVEVEVPVSEVDGTSGYKAEKAKDAVGTHQWKAGIIQGQLTGTREVFLTRWDKPIRIVHESEVADVIVEMFDGKDIVMPSNVVTPQLRKELEARGIAFVETDNQGKLVEGEHKGEHYSKVYGKKRTNKSNKKAEIIAEVERESAALGVPVRIARSVDELPDADTRKRAVDGKLKGYFDPRTGEVVLYEPNTENANDAKRTILHEIVGHKGLRQLIGEERYDKAMVQLMYMLPADVRDAVLRRAERHGWNAAIAMDEYLAEQAERDVQPTWWGKVNAKIRAILRNIGFNVKLTDADVTYLLWRSRKKLQGDSLNDMAVNATLKQAARKSAEAEAWNEQAFQDAEMRDFERNALPSIRHRMGADTNDYEKTVRTLGFKQAESWQDSMRSLLVFQAAIAKASGKDISDFENAYMYENRMSSANLMEMEQYRHMVYNPLLKEIHELEQMGASREDIINYLFAKSGLERNEVFARRDAKKHAEGDAAKEQQLYDKYKQKDYAGLTALTRGDAQIAGLVDDHSKKKTEYERLEQNKKRGVAVSDADLSTAKKGMNDARKAMITAIEAEAQRMVDEFEAQHNTDNLWDKIRNCTHITLNISHDAGVMSDEVYNELWNQFQYYIPLRGFAETTAEDVYLYLGGNDSPYNAPIKTAYGRTSLADDPIATIGNMAESAIVEANRNRLKQRFLYMVERHNTDLASISDVWLEYDDVNDEWHTLFAQIPDDATPSEAKRLQQEFEDRMKLLAEQNPGKYANASQQPNIPYRVVKKGDRQEHHVIVKRNGKDVVITINGNPRVAQAINGLTNPEQNQGMITRITSWINRNLSANFTMRNPAFMVSNFVRDGFYTNSMVWVKENPAYARQYNKNWAICTAQIASLVKRYKRYEKGDTSALDMNNDMDRMFYEFMINGGETGYTVIKSVEDYKGLISGEMKKMEAGAMGTARRVADTIGNAVDTFGRWAEDTSRFAAYMTSRQLGRTITKSIWDAKEISVNFNKKGSGNRMMGKFEQGNRWNYVLSNMSQLGRNLYVFWNAGMQGLNNFSKAAKKSPAKFTAMAGTYFTLGVIVAAAFSGDDDDDDYYNLPEYVRRNNICFKIGKGKYATLPLPIEIRAIYGLGELAYSYLSGREGLTHGEAVIKTIQQMTQVMPIDMMADGGGAMALVPSAAKPVAEVVFNVDWTGRPIYKEKTPWNQNDPTWTLAFKSTSPELVGMSRLVNEWTNKNTADGLERPYNRGWADNRYLNNPAVWEHIAEGYLGGIATMFNQTKKTLMMPFNEDLREVRNVPIVSRFVKDAGKEGRSYAARNEYYEAKNIMDSWRNEMSKAKKDILDTSLTEQQRLNAVKLRSSLEAQYTEAFDKWKELDKERDNLEKVLNTDISDQAKEEARRMLDDVMMQMATLVDAYR